MDDPKKFAKFIGKYLRWSYFFPHAVFLWIMWDLQEHVFYKTPPEDCILMNVQLFFTQTIQILNKSREKETYIKKRNTKPEANVPGSSKRRLLEK